MSDPYLPGAASLQPSPPAFPPPVPPARPAQIRVFGILHLVIAGFGLLMLAFSAFMQGVSRSMMESQQKAGGVQEIQAKMTREMTEAMQPLTYLQYGASVILSALLILAGIGLLKWKRSGLKWSNSYAWTSIILKVISIVGMFVLVLPRLNSFVDQMQTGSKGDETMIGVLKASMIGGMLVGPLMYCIYPVLVLILLNRKSVREALS